MENQPRSSFGPLQEAQKLHVNGAASVAELKEFLANLKGRNPQEVIGMVSSSMLIQSLGIATVVTVLFLAAFTVGPYLVYGPPRQKAVATPPAAATNSPATPDKETTPVAATLATGDKPDAAAAAAKMGLDEVKETDPTKNPLDKGPNIDNLLDGLE